MEGLVLRSTGSWYTIRQPDGSQIMCRLKGKLRLVDDEATNPVAVGDRVLFVPEPGGDTGLIEEVLPRENYIARESPRKKLKRHVIAANIDQALLVFTIKNPSLKLGFIDRFLMAAEAYHVPVVMVLNKADLLNEEWLENAGFYEELYTSIGYQWVSISATTGTNIPKLQEMIMHKVNLLSGQSGVGKSTLMNALDPGLELRTNELSAYTGKGVHATTFATMYELKTGGFIIDTPGIKELSPMDVPPEEVSHYFREMRNLLPDCRYSNCLHIDEPGCAVKEAVENGDVAISRYENYVYIVLDLKEKKRWEYFSGKK